MWVVDSSILHEAASLEKEQVQRLRQPELVEKSQWDCLQEEERCLRFAPGGKQVGTSVDCGLLLLWALGSSP